MFKPVRIVWRVLLQETPGLSKFRERLNHRFRDNCSSFRGFLKFPVTLYLSVFFILLISSSIAVILFNVSHSSLILPFAAILLAVVLSHLLTILFGREARKEQRTFILTFILVLVVAGMLFAMGVVEKSKQHKSREGFEQTEQKVKEQEKKMSADSIQIATLAEQIEEMQKPAPEEKITSHGDAQIDRPKERPPKERQKKPQISSQISENLDSMVMVPVFVPGVRPHSHVHIIIVKENFVPLSKGHPGVLADSTIVVGAGQIANIVVPRSILRDKKTLFLCFGEPEHQPKCVSLEPLIVANHDVREYVP